MALIFDEFDMGRPDVMFVIHRILERNEKFTLLDQNRVISPHPALRLFSTANTVGLGNLNNLYHGTQALNQTQVGRWNIVTTLNYLESEDEIRIVLAQVPTLANRRELVKRMIAVADCSEGGLRQAIIRP